MQDSCSECLYPTPGGAEVTLANSCSYLKRKEIFGLSTTFSSFSELFFGQIKCAETLVSPPHPPENIALPQRAISVHISERAYEPHIYELNLLLKSSSL